MELERLKPLKTAGNRTAQVRQIRMYAIGMAIIWTFLILASLGWFYQGHVAELHSIARAEALAALDTDMLYRRWGTHHGGVYVPVTSLTPPNYNLSHIPERDITTPSGRKLTLVNPALMTRQVYVLANQQNIKGRAHLTSLKPLGAENHPDEWEARALMKFEDGEREVSEVVQFEGERSMRLIRAFITEKQCLACHGKQGYRVGEVRGGLSVTVSLQPLLETLYSDLRRSVATHGIIWLAGLGIVGVGSRKLTNASLRLAESEERYRTVADYTMDWEYWMAPDGRFRYVSPSCEEITGYTANEFYDDPQLLTRLIHPDDQKLFRDHLSCIGCNCSAAAIVFRIITRNGEHRWISHVCRPVCGADGNSIGQRASNRDITERKLAEEMLQQQTVQLEEEVAERQAAQEKLAVKQHELEELNHSLEERVRQAVEELRHKDRLMLTQGRQAAMGEMIGHIAHQWRQPLNALALLLANIKDAYQYNELDDAYMEQANVDGNRLVQKMSATITDFRNFFRPDKERVAFSANKQVNDAISLMSSSFNNANIGIRIDSNEEPLLFGFPNEFSQVLLNLFSNAKEAILAHGVTRGEVVVHIGVQESLGVVTVRDNGGGIPAEIMDRIFEPYFSTKQMGTGIGLYMSKMIIERNMEGIISARNVEGGAEFTLKTPLAEETPVT